MRKINTLVLLAMMLSSTIFAQTFVSDLAIGGNNDGTTWADAYLDLGVAIANANEGDEIWVALGEYRPPAVTIDDGIDIDSTHAFVIDKNLKIYGGFIGVETSIDARNPTFNPVILNGDINDDDEINQFDVNKGDNARHIIYIADNITDATVIDGLFIWRGYANSNQQTASEYGGGIYCEGTPIIRNCTINECYARSGGGIFIDGFETGSVTIEGCDIDRNGASLFGSGIYAVDLVNISIIDTKISRNTCNGSGTINIEHAASVLLENCNIKDNQSEQNAAFSSLDATNIKFDQCNIENNHTTEALCIGIDLGPMMTTTDFIQTRIINNSSDSISAGISQGGGILNFTNCLIGGNVAGDPVMASSIFMFGNLNFNHTTVSSSAVPVIFAEGGQLNTTNTVFHSSQDGLFVGSSTIVSADGNICSDNSMDAGLTASGDLTATLPRFKNLANGNYIPAFDSPCRDAAVNSTETEDIDGNPRVGVPDIGAFENGLVATTQTEIPETSISISPTIVLHDFDVKWESQLIDYMDYQIVSQNGQQVATGQIKSRNQKLTVANLASGQYHIVFFANGQTTARSFIKMK